MKIFKGWSIFEIVLFISTPLIVLSIGIIFLNDFITIITSIVGIFCALFLAKGLILGQFFGLAIVILYSVVSYRNGYLMLQLQHVLQGKNHQFR